MKYRLVTLGLVFVAALAVRASAQEIDTRPLDAPVTERPAPPPREGGDSGAASSPDLADPGEPGKVVILQGLDKITARVSSIEMAIGSSARFGTLDITVRTCRKRPPEESPETTAFLEIRESREGQAAVLLFNGWMFASSPALSALEHPIYDVWVIDCLELG